MKAVKPGSCGAHESACWCIHDVEHEGPHECTCDGAWEGSTASNTFKPLRFPRILGDDDPVADILNEMLL